MKIKIASLNIEIKGLKNLTIPENLKKFITEDTEKPDIKYNVNLVDECPDCNWKKVMNKYNIIVYRNNGLEARSLILPSEDTVYGFYIEREFDNKCKEIDIFVRNDKKELLIYDTYFVSLFALERQMMYIDKYVLHCSYVEYKGNAILFSGPSGIGKSTQGNLWVKHMGAKVLNGDRAVIGQEAGKWYVYGWPVCGSSEICYNKKTELSSIVFLEQSKTDTIRKANPLQAVKALYSQITINSWNSDYINKAFNKIELLLNDVPIFEQECTMEKTAPECLLNALISEKVL